MKIFIIITDLMGSVSISRLPFGVRGQSRKFSSSSLQEISADYRTVRSSHL